MVVGVNHKLSVMTTDIVAFVRLLNSFMTFLLVCIILSNIKYWKKMNCDISLVLSYLFLILDLFNLPLDEYSADSLSLAEPSLACNKFHLTSLLTNNFLTW